ncbi:M15 family metallopeptidase [Teredinibacter turnerae]|uniref:M15 family metallopeptidase n=1 Tax=Teredinibacter turnerae TaxID=2426 RepID=UPI0030CE40DA
MRLLNTSLFAQLTGQTDTHIVSNATDCPVHKALVEPWCLLAERAAARGIQMRVASGFRSFSRQLMLWNAKANGTRPVLNDRSEAIDVATVDDETLLFAILRWSALPGASRHHWGCDVDVYDAAAVPRDYALRLVPEEYLPGGPFQLLSRWLDESGLMDDGFFRPYAEDRGGVAPELWHLSYRPLADEFASAMNQAQLQSLIENTDIALKDAILDNFHSIYSKFVVLPC